ncbi:MAG TPA: methyltransferase domain-containing protein [Micropepsaceae bacterium]|nr:methyltransferase domain-containing protein [Micropepsaceae bacterium]
MNNGPPRIFDRAAYRARRARALVRGGDLFLAQDAAAHIVERLGAINRRFTHGLDLHSRERVFPTLKGTAQLWTRMGFFDDRPTLVADEEALPFKEESFDLVTSVLSLHAVNDLPGTLLQIREALRPDGLFIGAMFAGETLHELRHAFASAEAETLGGASPRVAPFADVRELGGLLQRAGFALPVADIERVNVAYRDIATLFADMRALGETNVLQGRRSQLLGRRTLEAALKEYARRFAAEDGRFTATYEIAFLTGWAPHESQQKPLAPGSARTRLADALGTSERSAGERAKPD